MMIFTILVFLLDGILPETILTIIYCLLFINILTYSGWIFVDRGFGLLSAAFAGFIVSTFHHAIIFLFSLFSVQADFSFLFDYGPINLFTSFMIVNIFLSSIAMLLAAFGGILRRRKRRVSAPRETA